MCVNDEISWMRCSTSSTLVLRLRWVHTAKCWPCQGTTSRRCYMMDESASFSATPPFVGSTVFMCLSVNDWRPHQGLSHEPVDLVRHPARESVGNEELNYQYRPKAFCCSHQAACESFTVTRQNFVPRGAFHCKPALHVYNM